MSSLDRHAMADVQPKHRQHADAPQSAADLLSLAAALLTDPSLPRSSERQSVADRLRAMAKALATAQRADAAFQSGAKR